MWSATIGPPIVNHAKFRLGSEKRENIPRNVYICEQIAHIHLALNNRTRTHFLSVIFYVGGEEEHTSTAFNFCIQVGPGQRERESDEKRDRDSIFVYESRAR